MRQTPDMVAQETIPTTFALLVDSSQSMSAEHGLRPRGGRAPHGLPPAEGPRARRAVLEALRPITGPTNDRRTISEAVAAIDARGGTAMRDCMIEIAGRFEGIEGRRVIVLITDGYDEHSQSSLDEAVAALKEAGVTVYTVGIGGVAGISLKGHDELKAIAGGTGGRAFFPAAPERPAERVRRARQRRAVPLPGDVHADQPEARRHVARHLAADVRGGASS